jgi:hypothetical protein
MKCFVRSRQNLTKHSRSYAAKDFVRMQPKQAFFELRDNGSEGS